MTLAASLELVAARSASVDAPIVLFTYANPVLRMGAGAFARAAADAGVDGVLILDYPVEEAGPLRQPLVDAGLDPIFLVSPTTTDERIRASAELGRGFLYVISRLGVTGVRERLAADVPSRCSRASGRRPTCRWRWASASRSPSTSPRRAAWPMRRSSAARSST